MQEVIVTSEYDRKGNANLIACSYPKLAEDVRPGIQILCADGSLVLTVEECFPKEKYVKCRCVNTATIGYVTPTSRTPCAQPAGTHLTAPQL